MEQIAMICLHIYVPHGVNLYRKIMYKISLTVIAGDVLSLPNETTKHMK